MDNKFLSQMKTTFGKIKINKNNNGNIKEFIAKLSKGLMLPISMLPIAGLFLGIGAAIVTGAGNNEALIVFGNFLKLPGDVIFGALPILFAIAIAIAFTKDAGPAALSTLAGFLVFSGIQSALIQPVLDSTTGNLLGYDLLFYTKGALGDYSKFAGLPTSLFGSVLGIFQLQSSVFGGFIVGFTVAFLYNKFKEIQLPAIIGFFSGIRFVPIVTFAAFFPITILFLMIWPLVGILFNIIGEGLGSNMVGFNSFIFGYIERALVPFGLHHAFYSPLWYSQVGGSLDLSANAEILINGNLIAITQVGSYNITTWQSFFDFLLPGQYQGSISGDQILWAATNQVVGKEVILANGSKHILTFSDFTFANGSAGVNIGQYLQGKYPFMMFGLPAAALAMVFASPKENRKMSASIVLSAGLTSFLTGITEPIEFTFLFLAPWLFWGVHAFLCALSFGLMNWIGLIIPATAPHIGMTFSGGVIDWVLYGAIQIPSGSNAWWALIFGVIYAPLYFFLFYFLIKRFNIATPGRGDNTKLFTKEDFKNKNKNSEFDSMSLQIIQAYGGLDNIKNVDACITKLRIQVEDQSKVDEKKLTKELGAMGTIKPSKQSVYSVYGAKADFYKNKINDVILQVSKNPKLKDTLFKNITNTYIESKVDNEKSTEEVTIYAPVDCEIVELKDVPDPTFKDKLVGDGIAIIPLNPEIGSVIEKGKMELVFDSGHAYSFVTDGGTQILMHIGIDSIGLKNKDKSDAKVFNKKVQSNDNVNKETIIAKVDLEKLEKLAKSNITPIVVLNESLKQRKIKVIATSKKVKKGEILFKVKP